MKFLMKVSITISIFFLIQFNANGQQKFRIDFQDSLKITQDQIKNLNEGEFFQLVIENINLNLYKIEIIYKDTFKTKPLEIPTFTSFGTEELLKVTSSLSDMVRSEILISNQKLNIENKKIIEILNNGVSGLKYSNIEYLEQLKETEVLITKVYQRMLSLNRTDKQEESSSITDAEIEAIFKLRQSFLTIKSNLLKLQNDFQNELKSVPDVIRNENSIKLKVLEINNAYKQLHTSLDTTISTFEVNKVFKLLRQLTYMENNKNYKYTSLPIQYSGNQATLSYKVIPRDPNSLLQSYESFPIIFPDKKRGYYAVGISFYGANLFDKAYSITGSTSNDTTTYNIIKENDLDAEIGMASLVRFGTKLEDSENFGVHVTFGPGISITNKIKPRLLLGGGISFGSKHNFSLDVGFITGYVDVLSNAYSVSDRYSIQPETVVVSSLKVRVFGAVGYFFKF